MAYIPRTLLLAMLALLVGATTLTAQESEEMLSLPAQVPPRCIDVANPQFEHGRPRRVIDAIGWTFGIPKKIILWDRRVVNHHVSEATEQSLAEYLSTNGLTSTKVRINEYDPIGEWKRLAANREVGFGWRYSIGAFDTLFYTLIPGRLFGNDAYNPYTDSIYIYSDVPCLAQEQGSYAKLVHSHQHPGTYAALTALPVVQLWPERDSKVDVLDYTLETGTIAQQKEATRILYAEYGAEVGNQAAVLLGTNVPLTLAGAGIGHLAAWYDVSSPPSTPSLNQPSSVEISSRQGMDPGGAVAR